MSLKKGDNVIMSNCGEAEHYAGRVWECAGNAFKDRGGVEVVFLKKFSGYFLCDCLTKQEVKL